MFLSSSKKYLTFRFLPRLALVATLLCATPVTLSAQASSDRSASSQLSDSQSIEKKVVSPVKSYRLSPERYQQAHELGKAYFYHQLLVFGYTVLILLAMLKLRWGIAYARFAERASKRRVVQAFIFTPLLVSSLLLLLLPADIYRHGLFMKYGLSIQGWPSWFWDWTKFQLVLLLLASFTSWILYSIIRRSSRRWWFYFWLASLPLGLFLVFFQPIIFDPLFHKFEPLARRDPGLATELQKLVARTGERIPPERMFWMEAGNKTTTLNAYVTGFGSSKRIVVWDTTIAKMTTPQIVFVAGHEMGHYVLQHIVKGLLIGAIALLLCFYVGALLTKLILTRKNKDWAISSAADWSSMPLLILMFIVLGFFMNPIASTMSRYFEHQADQYALEVTHGLIADSGQVGAQAFQLLGDFGLDDPAPNPLDVFLYYDHPPITDRIEFSLHYDPWARGESPEFVR